jgi:release factor glutamine methyltransferase
MLLRLPGVYRADEDTSLLTTVLRGGGYARGCRVLDLGTGTGVLALEAARAGARAATGVDVSLRSVAAAWVNARARGAPMRVRRGDLFEPVHGQRFDLLLANPPYVPTPGGLAPRGQARSWDGGPDGRWLLDRVCSGAGEVLAPGGVVLIVHSGVCGAETTLSRLRTAGLGARVVARRVVPFGPVMRGRAAFLERSGLLPEGCRKEEIVVVEGNRG